MIDKDGLLVMPVGCDVQIAGIRRTEDGGLEVAIRTRYYRHWSAPEWFAVPTINTPEPSGAESAGKLEKRDGP